MSQKPDASYRQTQSRLIRQAAESYQTPDWGQEDEQPRTAYDRQLEQSGTPVRTGRRR